MNFVTSSSVDAYLCARASRVAYRDVGWQDELSAMGFTVVYAEDPRWMIITNGVVQLLVFMGTNNAHDIMTDLDAVWITYNGFNTHRGFVRNWLRFKPDVFKHLDPRMPLWITGHSLGAAVATLAVCELINLFNVIDIYTFGCPRVGLVEFCTMYLHKFGNITTRIVHDRDVIATVPLAPYEQPVQDLNLNDLGEVIGPVKGFFKDLWGDAVQLCKTFDGAAEEDHHIDHYVQTTHLYTTLHQEKP